MDFLLVSLGGALGAILRFGCARFVPVPQPWGVMLINIAGSLALGVVLGLQARGTIAHNGYLFLATGVMGAFTTFSALSFENYQLVQRQAWGVLVLSLGLQLVLGVGGLALGRSLFA